MEAMIYLSSMNLIVIDEELQKKFNSLRNEKFQIKTRNSDVEYTKEGYSQLNMSESDIIKKYKSSL